MEFINRPVWSWSVHHCPPWGPSVPVVLLASPSSVLAPSSQWNCYDLHHTCTKQTSPSDPHEAALKPDAQVQSNVSLSIKSHKARLYGSYSLRRSGTRNDLPRRIWKVIHQKVTYTIAMPVNPCVCTSQQKIECSGRRSSTYLTTARSVRYWEYA